MGSTFAFGNLTAGNGGGIHVAEHDAYLADILFALGNFHLFKEIYPLAGGAQLFREQTVLLLDDAVGFTQRDGTFERIYRIVNVCAYSENGNRRERLRFIA